MPIILKNNIINAEQPVPGTSTELDDIVKRLKVSTDALASAVSDSLDEKDYNDEAPTTIEVKKTVSPVTARKKDGTIINRKRINFFVNGQEVELTKEMQLLIDKAVSEL